jgi:hypothetical protein
MDIAKEIEVVEPEIVSIAPVDQPPVNKAAIAQKQQEAQLKATEYDIDKILPELDKAILAIATAISSLDVTELQEMSRKKLKDVAGALSSLMEKRNTIVKPAQVQTSSRKRRRYLWKDDKGHTAAMEEVEEPIGETPET